MSSVATAEAVRTLRIARETLIAAPVEVTFRALLDELGPESTMPGGEAFPMVLEARPGGRWYRDLGKDSGHLWGHVQVIKPPRLIELCGPMFMSFPAINFVQYRLTPEGAGTKLALVHRAMGLIPDEHMEGVGEGWEHSLRRISELATARGGVRR